VAKRAGRLKKGGEPDIRSAAITIIMDFQRGRLPHYVAPPELKDDVDEGQAETAALEGVEEVDQDLNLVGEETMKDDSNEGGDEAAKNEEAEDTAEESDDEEVQQPEIGDGEWED
jgi:nuclear GTP-binding protein